MVTKTKTKAVKKKIRDNQKEYVQAKAHITKLHTLIQRVYEDSVEDKIFDEPFMKMSETYETKHKQLIARIAELEQLITAAKESTANAAASSNWSDGTQTSRNSHRKSSEPLSRRFIYVRSGGLTV